MLAQTIEHGLIIAQRIGHSGWMVDVFVPLKMRFCFNHIFNRLL